MKAGMFGQGGRIGLWVNERGYVVNGAWTRLIRKRIKWLKKINQDV